MANFDYSKCKFITTSKNPSEYYLNIMKDYIAKTCSPDELDAEYNRSIKTLERLLNGDTINNPKVLHKICYYAFTNVWFTICQATTSCPGKPFALECLELNKYGEESFKNDGFYIAIQKRVKNILYDASIQVLLSSPDKFDNYPVIDLNELSRLIHNAIKKYYDDVAKVDARLLQSKRPNKNLHNNVTNAISKFESSLNKITYNYNPQSHYGV